MKDRILPDHWQYRPNTFDWNIFDSVCVHNEYALPNPLPPQSLVVDVGAHIGSFCWAARNVNANAIVAFEASPENYSFLTRNIEPIPNAKAIQAAVWHTGSTDELRMPALMAENTGGTGVFGAIGEPVPTLSIDRALSLAMEFAKCDRVRLLKLDCEGAEYPILSGADLSRVDALCGELHDGVTWCGRTWTGPDAAELIRSADFAIRLDATAPGFWKFWADKPSFYREAK